jgi:hypothetical protein
MKAIQIRYYGPTNTKGSRFKAWTEAGSMTVPYDYALGADGTVRKLAEDYCQKMEWLGMKLNFGTLPNGDHVATLGAEK